MPTKRCCCSPYTTSCIIGSDDFNRLDSENPVTGEWMLISGEWEIVAAIDDFGRLECVTEGPLITTFLQPTPIDSIYYSYRIEVKLLNTVDNWRVIVRYVDADEFDWVEIYTDGLLKMWPKFWRRVGGTDTLVMDPADYPLGGHWTMPTGTYGRLVFYFCYSNGGWTVDSGSVIWTVCSATPATALPTGGMGHVGFLAGNFDDWTFYKHWESDHTCLTCECFCFDGAGYECMPPTLTLTLTPITNDTNCTSSPGTLTYTMRQSLPTEPPPPGPPVYNEDATKRFWFSDPIQYGTQRTEYEWWRLECLGVGETETSFELIFLDYPSGAQTVPIAVASVIIQFPIQTSNGGSHCTAIECNPVTLTFQNLEKFLRQIGSGGPYYCDYEALVYSVVVTE